jgi:putative oxidoreductase
VTARPLRERRLFPRRSRATAPAIDLGRLLLRLTVGGTFFVHGTQKLFGWFGGYGPDGTGQFFDSVGLRPGRRQAIAAGSTETGGAILIALGLATPLAAAGLSAAMITALRTVVWNEGVKPATGEHEVLLAVAALALTEAGPGALSLDSALGVERSGRGWMLAALGAGLAGSATAISIGRRQPTAPAPPAPPEAPATPEAPLVPEVGSAL